MEQVGGIGTLEPLSILFLIIVQLGGRYLKIDLTPAQQKLINNSIFQGIILFSIILISIHILFNEYHKYNILSKKWLYNEKLIFDEKYNKIKEIYINNIKDIVI